MRAFAYKRSCLRRFPPSPYFCALIVHVVQQCLPAFVVTIVAALQACSSFQPCHVLRGKSCVFNARAPCLFRPQSQCQAFTVNSRLIIASVYYRRWCSPKSCPSEPLAPESGIILRSEWHSLCCDETRIEWYPSSMRQPHPQGRFWCV
jgi:hypothetical protein